MADNNTFVDTTPTAGNGDEYRDPSHIPSQNDFTGDIQNGVVDSKSRTLATWLRQKQWGVDVREAMALFVEWLSTKWASNKAMIDDNVSRQTAVEQRQTDLEGKFTNVISSATSDSEVIDARHSVKFGKFGTIDARFENMEALITKYVPQGFEVTINHNLNRMPQVSVFTYDWAIGTETNGLDTAPSGLFGGSQPVSISNQVVYSDVNNVKVILPADYQQGGTLEQHNGVWYLIDGIKTLKFVLS